MPSHPHAPRTAAGSRLRSLALLALLPLALAAGPCHRDTTDRVVALVAGPDMEFQIRQAFITARPGDRIEIPAGTFDIRAELALDVPNVTVAGAGMDETILDFANQEDGAEGILVTASAFTIQDLAVIDTTGDGIKVQDAEGVTFSRVRVEWTLDPPDETNGAYGLYPVRSSDIIVEDCVIRGASDAGVYVGQSTDIVVRSNIVEKNVAGIEIENSKNADVYGNSVTDNTGGVLVFDLPGLAVQGGQRVRVWGNLIYDNDRPNFAPEGNIVGIVPGGTGVIVMANDDVEVFWNFIYENDSTNILILSYDLVDENVNDPNYDPYPEKLHIHDNYLIDGGHTPQGLAAALPLVFGSPVPDIAWDGVVNPEFKKEGGVLPADKAICVHSNNPGVRFGNFDFPFPSTAIFDAPQHDCSHANVAQPVIAPYPDAPPIELEYSDEEVDALCTAAGSGVNWPALVVECPQLSDYRLFETGDPRTLPNSGGIPYDLNTPLHSDYTSKYRVVFVPPGQTVPYDATEVLDFPVGTVIAKTFAVRADHRVTDGPDELIETRLLVHRESGWAGIPYIWNEAETEAFLSLGGGAVDIAWIDALGDDRATRYSVPNVTQCRACHNGEGNSVEPIGPSIRQLNHEFDYTPWGVGKDEIEQLSYWTDVGVLTGAAAPGAAPQLTDWEDPSATLADRSRAYLEGNCAHCHSPDGRANTSGLFLEHDRVFGTSTGLCKPPVAAGAGSGGLSYDIVPGSPNDSILFFRMSSTNPAIRMPELAHTVPHDEALDLMEAWITGLPGNCPP